ncbi:metallophosphoesterase [Inquilinus sp. CAU 1745]|uniref:metallophosphoesterase n=1 Tax=Inquilinus sp. CAU 1745 TaxID=3140369 RepID=UPI00325A7684
MCRFPIPVLAAAALLLNVAGAAAQEEPLFRFGLVADPQYAPVPPKGTRYYGNSLWKLSEAVEDFNGRDLEFVITVGDVIDRHFESFDHLLPIYGRLEHPAYFALGNHDFDVAADYLASVPDRLGLEARYYDFEHESWRFIVLDGNDLSLFANPERTERHAASVAMLDALTAQGAVNAKRWNGGLGEEQLRWLEDRLEASRAAGERVIVLGHYPLYPEDQHNLWNAEAVTELLGRFDNVAAYLNGHNHAGGYGELDGVHYVTFQGMVETATENAYAVVDVHADRLEIDGEGREEDRTLPLPAAIN